MVRTAEIFIVKINKYFKSSNVPIFIRVQHEWRNMFIGLCEGSGLRTHFNVCYLKNAPHQYRHLAGLLEIFKSKLVDYIFFCLYLIFTLSFIGFSYCE